MFDNGIFVVWLGFGVWLVVFGIWVDVDVGFILFVEFLFGFVVV